MSSSRPRAGHGHRPARPARAESGLSAADRVVDAGDGGGLSDENAHWMLWRVCFVGPAGSLDNPPRTIISKVVDITWKCHCAGNGGNAVRSELRHVECGFTPDSFRFLDGSRPLAYRYFPARVNRESGHGGWGVCHSGTSVEQVPIGVNVSRMFHLDGN
jgi:hypothetical protein